MARIAWAEWKPLGPITDEPPITPKVLVFHTMDGYLRGTDTWFRRRGFIGVESTFGVGGRWDGELDGAVWQWQDTHREADAQAAGNRYANSVETSDGGSAAHPWSSRQLDALVRLTVDWCRLTRNPCRLISRIGERGLGFHSQFKEWNPDTHACPGAVRLGQLRTIVIPKARALLEGNAYTPYSPPAGPLVEDGILGAATIKALQRELGVGVDGIMGPETRIALQRELGVRPDSIAGPVTIKALQRRLGLTETGDWDTETTRALQRALNRGTF